MARRTGPSASGVLALPMELATATTEELEAARYFDRAPAPSDLDVAFAALLAVAADGTLDDEAIAAAREELLRALRAQSASTMGERAARLVGDLAQAAASGALDAEAVRSVAEVLTFVDDPAVHRSLSATARSTAAAGVERELALVGLRASGGPGVRAAIDVAASADSPALRAFATAELGSTLAHPDAIESRRSGLATVTDNLEHADAGVRRAALQSLHGAGAAWTEPSEASLRHIAEADSDPINRSIASAILRRW
ncbi:MAG: hypothetical protein AAGI22_23695 [Planctomycetota bacterium]